MSPMDATQFTTQLVQFSQVEQSVNMNKYLSDLVDLQVSAQMQSAFGYVGQTVDVLSDEIPLAEGEADLFYAVAGKPTAVALQILDANGKTVRTMVGSAETGIQRMTWDGRDGSGTKVKDGTYTVKVIAEDPDGVALPAQAGYSGSVSEVTNINGQMQLYVNGLQIPMTEIVSVRKTAADA
jgi:flagellar basal-body rod modification protein FlgD